MVRSMGLVLQKMRLELALRAAFSRLLTKPGPVPSDSSTGRTARGFKSHNFLPLKRAHKRTLFKGRTYKRNMKNEDQFINQYRFPLGDPDQAIALMGAFRFWYMDSQIMQREYLHAGHHCI